jgi:hypothetical protein
MDGHPHFLYYCLVGSGCVQKRCLRQSSPSISSHALSFFFFSSTAPSSPAQTCCLRPVLSFLLRVLHDGPPARHVPVCFFPGGLPPGLLFLVGRMRTRWPCFRAAQRSSGRPAATAICRRRRPAVGRGFDVPPPPRLCSVRRVVGSAGACSATR